MPIKNPAYISEIYNTVPAWWLLYFTFGTEVPAG